MLEYFSNNKVQDNIQYQINDFMFRWKKIERIVAKENSEGLLLVTGLDGRQSYQTIKLFNWLFLGLSGKLVYVNKYLDEIYGEIILLISKTKSQIFITPKALKNLSGYIYAIPGLEVFCPTNEEYQNKQKLDILKISHFYTMVKGKKNISVLIQDKEDVKSIEKWPMIQSYALEQVGGTFFSLKYQISDLSAKIQNLYKNHDKYSLEMLTQQNARRIAGHIFGSTRIIEYTQIGRRGEITEQQLNESLKDAVEILEIEQSNKQEDVRAKVLFGRRTNDRNNRSQDYKILNEEADCPPNFHMTIEYCDPYSELRICRTYFLGKNVQHYQKLVQNQVSQQETFIVDMVYSIDKVINHNYRDEELLVNLYSNIIQGTLESIIGVTKDYRNLNVEFLQVQIYSKIKSIIVNQYGNEQRLNMANLKVQLLSYNALGELQKVDFKDIVSFKLTPHFHIIRVELNSIPSLIYKDKQLGALLFSESFVLQQGCYLLITKDVPYFNFWNCEGAESAKFENLKRFAAFQKLGKIITGNIDNNRILVPTDKLSVMGFNIPILKASYYFHENGIRIHEERLGWFVILYSDMKNPNIINRMDSQWLLFQLEDGLLFNSLGKKNIAMEFKGKAFDLLMQKINAKESSFLVNYSNELPSIFTQNPFVCRQLLNKKNTTLIVQSQILISSFLYKYLEAKQLMILNNMKDLKLNAFKNIYSKVEDVASEKQNERYNIVLVNGTYASGKTKFAQNLSRYGRDYKFIINVFCISSQNLYSKLETNAFLQMLEQFIMDHKIEKGPKYLTLIVVPFWLNSRQINQALTTKYHIRSVITKINASNFFSTPNLALTENVLTYATPGHSQIIVIDTFSQSEEVISTITNVVWKFNPVSKVFRVVNNSLTNGLAKDILLTNKYTSEIQTFNRQKYAVYYDFGDLSKLQVHFVQFKLPIKARASFKALASQGSYLYSLKQIEAKLRVEREEAENSKDDLMKILFQIREQIYIANKRSSSIRIRYVKGNCRVFNEKQVFEITSANQFYKEKECKQATQLGFHIISVGYNQHQILQFLYDMTTKQQILSKTKALRNVQSVTEEERKALERANRNNLLTNNQFFDGTFFRDVQGYILKEHPNIKVLVQQFIKSENQKICQYNRNIRQQWNKYQMSYK